jgi:fructokinase
LLLGLRHAHIVKMNEEELSFLNGGLELKTLESMVAACRHLWHDDLRLLVITRGPHGCLAVTPENYWAVEGFNVTVEDTIGAGDGFMAGLLSGLLPYFRMGQVAELSESTLLPILRRANAVGALTTTRRGGIPALPTLFEVEQFLAVQ